MRCASVLAVVLASMAVVAGCGLDRAFIPPRVACGAYEPPNRVVAELRLDRLDQLRRRIPRLGVDPSGPDPAQPALVIVFTGPGRDLEIRGGMSPRGLDAQTAAGLAHLCILSGDGTTSLVANVDITGFAP